MTDTKHTDSVESTIEEILNPYPPFPVEGDHGQHTTGIYVPDVDALKERMKTTLQANQSQQVEEAVRKTENRFRFDIEGKMYLAKELVKHIEHHDKLDASFERGRVNAFEEMLQALTPNHQD